MKRGLVLLIIVMSIFLGGLISAAGESCSITDRVSCSGTIIMGLSDSGNGHGELASQGNYDQVLCCNFPGSLTCDGSNKIISLSSATNAHAEIPTGTSYANDVCFSDLSCISTSLNCGATEFPLPIFSLSDSTNAHIGGINDFETNICCTLTSTSPSPQGKSVYWTNSIGSLITQINVSIGNTFINLVLENSGLSEGTIVNFDIWEDDFFADDFIKTITASVDANGKAVASWIPTQEDMDKTIDYDEFYFVAEGETSTDLSITIILQEDLNCNQIAICGDYSGENFCNSDADLCNVASDSVPTAVDCSDSSIDCFCSWDSTNNQCDSSFTLNSLCGDGLIYAGETCDGDNWGPITGCSDFDDFTGGVLGCSSSGVNECTFDTSLCTGGVECAEGLGNCYGDEIINPGETCDGDNWGPITGCSDFDDFTGGVLLCESPGRFDTTQCLVGTEETTPTVGVCTFSSSTGDNCDDGFLSYSWTASWDGAPEDKPLECVDGDKTLECPAQIQLPFFGFWNFIITIILIMGVYTVLFLKRKGLIRFIK